MTDNEDQPETMAQTLKEILAGMTAMKEELNILKASKQPEEMAKEKDDKFLDSFVELSVQQAEKEAKDAIQALKRARRESRGGSAVKMRYAASSPYAGQDGEFRGYSEDVTDRFEKKIKSVMAMVSKKTFDGTKKTHKTLISTVRTALKFHGMAQIVSAEEHVWDDFSGDVDNQSKTKLMMMVLEAVLEAVLDKGPAYTKYRLQKRKDPHDVRKMWLAVCDANKLSTTKLTKRKLKRELKKIQWQDGKDYDEFIDELSSIFDEFEDLEDSRTGESLAINEEEQVDIIMDKMMDSQEELPEQEQTWEAIFDAATLTFDESMTEFTLDKLHSLVRPKVESATMRKKKNTGQVRAGIGSDICYKCHKPGHHARDCPNKSQKQKTVCRLFASTGNCRFGANCRFMHQAGTETAATEGKEEGDGNEATKMTKEEWCAKMSDAHLKKLGKQLAQHKSMTVDGNDDDWWMEAQDTLEHKTGKNCKQQSSSSVVREIEEWKLQCKNEQGPPSSRVK